MSVRSSGFTLLEMAVVMFIISALMSATIAPIEVQLEARARRATSADMEQSLEALYGFALAHGRLPCPDAASSGNGREDRLGDRACIAASGSLPYVDLGVSGHDAWGNRLRYQVTAAVSLTSPGRNNFAAPDDGICRADDADLDLCEQGAIEIRTRGNDPASATLEGKFDYELADLVPAVVISHGANGFGALAQDGSARQPPPARNRDELENSDGDTIFYARIYAANQSACADDRNEASRLCEFDDIVRWISPTILSNRMVSAGQLP